MAAFEQGLFLQLLLLHFYQALVHGTACKLTGPLVSYTTCPYGCCNETSSQHICCEKPRLTDEMIWGLVVCLAIIFLIIGCIVYIGCRKHKKTLNNGIVLSTNLSCSYINSGAVASLSCESSLNVEFYELTVPQTPSPMYGDLPPSYESIVCDKDRVVDALDV
ncbi:hypothetical protein LOTGIDRAFT_165292 [Lottia gigantea]|uniref:Vesicular, overexpressed in cancer, prosurvival protein 1 n=1 Tax=Lottia gigantea TaxID=225164 RepID=V3ZCT0_LOTGI|nr:hypothetical protein LOTGIDRAFT_165292 [Lottia gigantea]ESO88878.1 hypothetical protein LOTGIDRAFT_165292 [Lottia gigantea]